MCLLSIAGVFLFAVSITAETLAPGMLPLTPAQCKTQVEKYENERGSMSLEKRLSDTLGYEEGQCTYFAMGQRADLELLNYFRRECFGAISNEWNGGLWPQNVNKVVSGTLTLQQAFRQIMGREWYWTVSNAPAKGATAHWQNCSGISTHVAVVVDFDGVNLKVLQDNVPLGEQLGTAGTTQLVSQANCINYIYPVEIRNPSPSIVQQSYEERFSTRWPFRWVSVSTPYRFELSFDANPALVLNGSGNLSKRVSLWPGEHTARIKFWAPPGAPSPVFDQKPQVAGVVLADEPDDNVLVPISYSLVPNPSFAQAGDRVTFAYSAREQTTGLPIAAIEVYLNDQRVNRSLGSSGTWIWQTSASDTGKFRVRLQARLEGIDRIQSKEFEYMINARESAMASGPAAYIGFALPHAQANWGESHIPISFSIAQSALESAWGRSGLATQYNNYFGIKCPGLPMHSNCVTLEGASWRVYSNARESFLDHGRFLQQNSRYQNAFSYTNDSVSFAREVARAGYAGADWEPYFNKIKSTMDAYNLYQYDQGGIPLPQPTAPNPPTLGEPRNGVTLSPTADVTLRWNLSANASQYKVELWGGPYSTMTPCDWQSGTTCRIGTMWPGTMQWRVKARNANGESEWSDTWSFTVQAVPSIITITPTWTRSPTATATRTQTPQSISINRPTLSSPTNGTSMTQNTSVTLSWNTAQNATQYKVELWGGPYDRMTPCDWQSGTTCHIGTMWPGTMLWRVKARNASGQESDWSDTWSFTIRQEITPTWTPTTRAITPGRLVLVDGLSLSSTSIQVNQSVNARFRVRNDGGTPITARYLGVKGRHSSGASYDFHWIENLTLQPGQEFTYDVNRSFDRTGSYSLTPNWFDGANWRDLTFANGSTNYVTINVVSAPAPPTFTPVPPSPGRVVLTQGLTISPSNPARGQNVNARFVAKNIGGSPVTFRFFGVKGRHSSGAVYDFLWLENFTLQPGQEFTYDVNRTFDRTGSFTFTPNYSLNGSAWADLAFANGSTSYVTISVR